MPARDLLETVNQTVFEVLDVLSGDEVVDFVVNAEDIVDNECGHFTPGISITLWMDSYVSEDNRVMGSIVIPQHFVMDDSLLRNYVFGLWEGLTFQRMIQALPTLTDLE